MAAFNFREFSLRLDLPGLIQGVNKALKNLGLVLKGVRTEGDGRIVSANELEVEKDLGGGGGGGVIVTTPDGSARYRIAVDNSGNVTTTAL